MPFTPTRPPAENTAEKQRVRQQMLARNWHDDAISSEMKDGKFDPLFGFIHRPRSQVDLWSPRFQPAGNSAKLLNRRPAQTTGCKSGRLIRRLHSVRVR